MREATRLAPDAGFEVREQSIEMEEGVEYVTYWFEDGTPQAQCIRLANLPGTLSADILRLHQNLPLLEGDHVILGNQIFPLQDRPKFPEPFEDDSEDLTAALASLPTVEFDLDKHFLKKGKYESEIKNLLKCQGGSCPGTPISPHIIQLLGKVVVRRLGV